MASAWGTSWGSAWGNAWGAIAQAVRAVGGGIGHGKKPKKPGIVVVTVDGQDYRVPLNQLQSFLDSLNARVTQPEAVRKAVAKKVKKSLPAYAPPQVIIKSAPAELLLEIRSTLDRNNEILAHLWAGMLAKLEREREDEEILVLLLA